MIIHESSDQSLKDDEQQRDTLFVHKEIPSQISLSTSKNHLDQRFSFLDSLKSKKNKLKAIQK